MAIHPIDYRYGTPEMRAVWGEENRFACIVRAEAALARAGAECELFPRLQPISSGKTPERRPSHAPRESRRRSTTT